MIKLILGGFPCTQFSLAQKKNRINKVDFTAEEFVEFHNNNRLWYKHIDDFEKYIGNKLGAENYKFAEGLQLFFNCVAAIDRTIEQYPNDKVYYMFENVSSMQKEIKETLTEILNKLYGGVSTEINSALVSAQKAGNARDYIKKHHTAVSFESCVIVGDCKTIEAQIPKIVEKYGEVPEMFNAYNASKIEDKSPTLSTGSMVTSSCATCKFEPVNITEPIRLGDIDSNAQAHRVYSPYGKSVTINANGGGQGGKTGLYATPVEIVITEDTIVEELWGGNLKIDGKLIYKVENGLIPFKEDFYPINLPDGYYLIRKLTVKESMRLQTIPEWYEFPVSDTQAYKMLGNGWTKDVISHILSFVPNIQNEEIDVLSLYDGMSCGKLALMDLGCEKNINTYRAYEIDPYAIKTTQHNFPDTIQCGDAFKVRDIDWEA